MQGIIQAIKMHVDKLRLHAKALRQSRAQIDVKAIKAPRIVHPLKGGIAGIHADAQDAGTANALQSLVPAPQQPNAGHCAPHKHPSREDEKDDDTS